MRRPFIALLPLALVLAGVALPATAASAIEPPRVRVTPGVSSVLLGATAQLTATVTGLENTAVTWSVRSGGGTVDATGLFTPPATLPAKPVTVVRATAVEDSGVYGEATVTVASGVVSDGFAPAVPVEGGSYDTDTGDVNGDGVADVVRLQIGAGSLQLVRIVALVSNGAGGHTTKTSGYSFLGNGVNDYFGDVVLGDWDGDGDLDAYAAIEAVTTAFNEYTLFRNDGTGAFAPDPVVMAGTGEGRAGARAVATDFDGDGRLDVVRLDRFGTVTLHRGNGNGTFAQAVGLFSTSWGYTITAGDLTGDGRPEIAVGTWTQGGSPVMETFDVARNDGFGNVAGKTTYTAGLNPTPVVYDADGDGWNDLLVGIGGVGATHHPPRAVVFANQATGTGSVATPAVQVLPFRPHDLHPAHVDGDGVLDLAGATYLGPVLLRRTGPNAFAAKHSTAYFPHHVAVGDVTGDGRVDVYATADGVSTLHAGSADAPFHFAVDPVVTWINAGHTAALTATIRNSSAVPDLVWTASRGSFPSTFDRHVYTAPATASPSGTPVTLKATISGTQTAATRQILVVNESYQFTTLGGQQVRQVVRDPALSTTLYAATGSGVYRLGSGGATSALLGVTTSTGTDAKEVAVARDGSTDAVVARFATGLWRWDLDDAGAAWTDADGGLFTPVSVGALPGTATVYAAATTGAVWRSTDGGLTWSSLGGTGVTRVVPITADSFWAVRSSAPRVAVGTVADGAATLAARELPQPAAAVHALAVDPDDRAKAFVATAESGFQRMYRGTTAGEWTPSPVPAVVDQVTVSPDGTVLAADDGTQSVFKSRDDGASWYSIYRGFASNLAVHSVAARADGLTLVGTAGGLYTPLDLDAPVPPAVTAGPAGTTGPGGSNAFAFTFSGTGTSHLCALDDAGWSSCTGSRTYSGPLASGTHTFSVVAVDENGNESAPGTWSWTVDATPAPVPAISSGPAALTQQTTAAFGFTLSGDATGAVCSLDGATPSPCVSGVAYSGIGEGSHTFAVRSVDEFGNRSAAATHTWTVDTTPPPTPWFTSAPHWSTTSPDATFTWVVQSGVTYTCTLDAAPVTCGMGSFSVTGLPDGSHVFTVVASDAAGNTAGNSREWWIDTTPPAPPVLTLTPPETTSSTSARFEYTSEEWAYNCTLDGQPVSCWSDGFVQFTGLAAGPHTFFIQARDSHDRLSDPVSFSWTVVVEDPPGVPVIQTGPSGYVRTRTAAFTYTVPEGTTATCSLDGATPTACDATGITYTDLAEGPHTFAVRAVAEHGTASAPATAAWTVDVTPPATPVLTSKPPLRTGSASASFGWTADPALTYACSLDGASVACGDGSFTATELAHGAHTFAVVARDAAGNASDPGSHGWRVDLAGPAVVIDEKPDVLTRDTTLSFAVSSPDPDVETFHCALAWLNEPIDCADGTVEVTVPAESAPYLFRVYATDDLGNAGATVEYDFDVDFTTPSGAIHTDGPSLTAPRIVSWDELVTNVTPTTVRIVKSGSTTAVPVAFACRDHANVVVPCTGATVREAVLTPVKPLVPGQTYTLHASGVTDRVGNVMEPKSATFRASTVEQERTAGATVSWRKVSSAAALGGSYAVSDVKGATATYAFTGSRIVWYGMRGPSFGTADVAIDGVPKGKVSFYSSTSGSTYKVFDGLPNAKHTLTITVRGEKGSTRGTGTFVALDAVKVGATTSSTPAATYAWARRLSRSASGGAYALEDNAGASYTVRFRGTAFSWVTVLGPGMGKATVAIDGRTVATVDNYASATRYGYVRKFAGLSDAEHTVKITVLGTRRSGATGRYVAFDRFGIT